MRDQSQHQRKLPGAACRGAPFDFYILASDSTLVSLAPNISKRSLTFKRFTQVLAVGNRCSSLPASRMAKRGFSCLKPLESNGHLQRRVIVNNEYSQKWRSTTTCNKSQEHPPLLLVKVLQNLQINVNGRTRNSQSSILTFQNICIVGSSSPYKPPYWVCALKSCTSTGAFTPPSNIWSSC